MVIKGVADNLSDGDQSYAILLSADNTSSDLRFKYVDPPDVSLRNLDLTDKGTFYVSAASQDTDENAVLTSSFTVRLSSEPTDNVTIYAASSDTTEGVIYSIGGSTSNTSSLTFSSSDWNSPKSVVIKGVADNLSDGDQSYAILLSADNTSSDLRFKYVDPPDVSLRNLDLTDKGTFYVSAASQDTDENAVLTSSFTVRLSSEPTDNVTIYAASSDTTEGVIYSIGGSTSNTSSLTFSSSDWNSPKSVVIKGVADNLSDGDQSYAILLSADNTSSDLRFKYVDPPDVSLRNLDLTDKGTFYVSAASQDTDENAVLTSSFTVRLSSEPTDNVTIYAASSDTTEGVIYSIGGSTSNTSSLTFSSSDWNSPKSVVIKGVADNLSDGDQSYAILLSADNTSSDLRFKYVDPPDVSLRNLDLTDKGTFYVSAASQDTDENAVLTSSFTVRLSSEPTDNVTIYAASSDTTEGVIYSIGGSTSNTSSLTFSSSDWNSPKSVVIKGVADNLSDGDQSYAILLSADNTSSDLRFKYVDPPDVSLRNLDLTDKGTFYVSAASQDTDENAVLTYGSLERADGQRDDLCGIV